MDNKSSAITNAVAWLNDDSGPMKRKFTPNISKALSKKTFSETSKSSDAPKKTKDKRDSGKEKVRGRINRTALDDENPRFVQSYSIFETGVGCVVKSDSHSVEMHAVGSGVSKTSVRELKATEIKADPSLVSEPFIVDINQCFKNPPTFMEEPEAKLEQNFDEKMPFCCPSSTVIPTSTTLRQAATIPGQLFDETLSTGSLFTLKLPESLLSEDSPIMNEGKFGKIQLLDNGETRLVISDAVFRLVCPRPTTYSSDVIVVEEREDGIVGLNSIGHLDQCVTAVPDLDRFADLGR